MNNHVDALIVGGGPTGLAAAVAARSCGLDVALVDEQPYIGGQLFRNRHLDSGRQALDAHDNQLGQELITAFEKSGAACFTQSTVWGLHGQEVHYQHKEQSQRLSASKILFAVGGMERPVPFKGWTLPGVMTAGAAEILLCSGMPVCASNESVVLAGNGPLLLSLAVHLLESGVSIAAWLDTGRFFDKLQSIVHMGSVYKDIPYFLRGMNMARKILQHKIPFVTHVTHMEALGTNGLERVCYEKNGQWHEIVTTKLIRHENVIPRLHIASALGVELAWERVQRYWYPVIDAWGRSSQDHIYMAGDGAFVHGGEAAIAQGHSVGIAMAWDLGVISEKEAQRRMAPYTARFHTLCQARKYLRKVFAPQASIYRVPDETCICRCEGVTAKDVRRAVQEGYTTPDEVKRFTRVGMGPCQGRMCGNALAEIVAQELGCAVESMPPLRSRQPFAPVSLAEYCSLH